MIKFTFFIIGVNLRHSSHSLQTMKKMEILLSLVTQFSIDSFVSVTRQNTRQSRLWITRRICSDRLSNTQLNTSVRRATRSYANLLARVPDSRTRLRWSKLCSRQPHLRCRIPISNTRPHILTHPNPEIKQQSLAKVVAVQLLHPQLMQQKKALTSSPAFSKKLL